MWGNRRKTLVEQKNQVKIINTKKKEEGRITKTVKKKKGKEETKQNK